MPKLACVLCDDFGWRWRRPNGWTIKAKEREPACGQLDDYAEKRECPCGQPWREEDGTLIKEVEAA